MKPKTGPTGPTGRSKRQSIDRVFLRTGGLESRHKEHVPDWERNVFDAIEGLTKGEAQPVADYLQDAIKLLNLLSHRFDRKEENPSESDHGEAGFPADPSSAHSEWNGSYYEVREAIEKNHVEEIGWFLKDLSKVLARLERALRGHQSPWRWQLKFFRKGRGRPPSMPLLFRINTALRMGAFQGVKQDSTIKRLVDEWGVSRATIMRAKALKKKK